MRGSGHYSPAREQDPGGEGARRGSAAGPRVAVTDRNPERLTELTDDYPGLATAIGIDVADPDSVMRGVREAREALGDHLDVLVNNAAYGEMGASRRSRKSGSAATTRPTSSGSSA